MSKNRMVVTRMVNAPSKNLLCRALLLILMLLNIACTTAHDASSAADKGPPNFIVIMADDLGYGDIGVFGASLIDTPNLDRMSNEGIRLESFYASANTCTPSRGGLLTGRYPIRLDLVSDVARPTNDIGLSPSEITIGGALQALGYRTALIGKWHLGHQPERSPLHNGFDRFYGLLHSNDMHPLELYDNTQVIEDPVNQSTLTERYTTEAIRFIEENQQHPFFLYLPHTMPHTPLFVSERFEGQSQAGLYGDVVETLDWSTGEILNTLERLGLDDNTMVIFTSDNGPWFEGSAGSLRDRKGVAWDGGLRVPFIARWPSVIPPGQVSDEPTMNIDLFPTLLALAGGELPDDRVIDGKNIMPVLRDGARSPHEALFMFQNDRIAGVRSGQWKLVVESNYLSVVTRFDHPDSYYGPTGLLFDLQRDPSETYSYAREYPDVVARLRGYLEQAQRNFDSTILESMWNRP
ncbi:sulfatase family protein [Pseudohongiella spirulinae]|uniref:Arylsulfatase n=1 Tax=Pseudohongiella spirulinae TaxID=1249552 RepID=A0A0S2KF58_9GAMM|nr:sulfatase [Pseudohongiella spirulinae]ALO46873.1 Arylsulfatase [Pseudohongiella spirulinae]